MKDWREHGPQALVALAVLAVGAWLAFNLEWVDVEVPQPLSAAQQRDSQLHLKQMLGRLGTHVATPENLDRLPPRDATLVLTAWDWNILPQRAADLRRWVEAGGHLVVPYPIVRHGDLDWVGVAPRRRDAHAIESAASAAQAEVDATAEAAASAARAASATSSRELDDDPRLRRPADLPTPRCPGLQEPVGVTPAYGEPRAYATCMGAGGDYVTQAAPTWALDGPDGHAVLRVPAGHGSVTVVEDLPWDNRTLLQHDNGLIVAAMLRAGPGRVVWLVADERRPPLLAFLWDRGAPAILFGAAALGFALWRGARRFGPALAPRPSARRSMAEQVRGTAHYIQHRGSPALHAAQSRALAEAARPHIRGIDALSDAQRSAAIAALTGLDAGALAQALAPRPPPARHPPSDLALLETARRRLAGTPDPGPSA